ncbi:MAG: hypothetical protein E7390_01340 [Ruminococcaceae bacterium]|nr:hypothetical protein [Oscillospiraceae bacterium]
MKNVKKIFLFLIFFAFLALGLSIRYTIGYGMFVEGQFVGVVRSPSEADAITEIICAESHASALSTTLYPRLLVRDTFTPAAEVSENTRSAMGIETEIITLTEPIPFGTGTVEDAGMYQGTEAVTTEGVDGARTVVKQITKMNGSILQEKVLSVSVSAEPVAEITTVGTKPRPAGVGTGDFTFPLSEITVSSNFGYRWDRQHNGIDFAADAGTAISAADSGTVIFSGPSEGYGNLIILDHQNGYTTYYAHCSILYAAVGAMPEKGEVIAGVGSTGNSTGPHLHFEIRKDGTPQNPLEYLPGIV